MKDYYQENQKTNKFKLYLGLEYLSGGDLRYHISKKHILPEKIVTCIITGLEYLHSQLIIHRDIKPENLILDKNGYLKITDLGIAQYYSQMERLDSSGTPGYMAPEILFKQPYKFQSDFFSCGVIIYELMKGKRPFLKGETRDSIKKEIEKHQVQVTSMVVGWSQESKDFTNKCLLYDSNKRLGANGIHEIKNHAWFQNFPWEKLQKQKLQSPYIPNVNFYKQLENNFDSSMSDISFNSEDFEIQQQPFLNYSYEI